MGKLRKHLALARDAVGHDAIERGNAIRCDEQEGVAEVKDLADLAALELLDAGQVELQQRCGRHVSKDEARGLKFKVQSSSHPGNGIASNPRATLSLTMPPESFLTEIGMGN